MKKIKNIILLAACLSLNSCYDLDLTPLSMATSNTWYSNETEFEMAVKDLYNPSFWNNASLEWTDDYTFRETPDIILLGQLSGQSSHVTSLWTNAYKAIGRANTILTNTEKGVSLGISQAKIDQFAAEASFVRAAMYSNLVFRFGDVVWVDKTISIEEAFKIGRTSKEEIIKNIYADFDKAANILPVSYSGVKRATKGAAYAYKARFALYMGDFAIAEEAAKKCIDLGAYELHKDFANLFLASTRDAKESVFATPRSLVYNSSFKTQMYITRNPGGWASKDPSWALLASFLCTDGLPIDESPLFNPRKPFENRDPRCAATIVAFGSNHLGFEYDPNPEVLEVMNYKTGKKQLNNDTRANNKFASFNALAWKKGIDEDWTKNGYKVDPDNILLRYADVLLMYAEAKIEQNKIDQSTLDAMNTVRARAYGVDKAATDQYPAITETTQSKLRSILRIERRMEFVKEGLRYNDIIRWKIAGETFNTKDYAPPYPASLCVDKVTSKGLWFWSHTPKISENGTADFSELEKAGTAQVLSQRIWDERQYLWPIPTKEILINKNIKQNPGY